MTISELQHLIPIFLERLRKDGHSEEVMSINRWVTGHFVKYCMSRNINEISMDIIAEFLKVKYDIELYHPLCGTQISVRRPLLILWEYSQTGTYQKNHLYEKSSVPVRFNDIYLSYCSYLNSLALNVKTKSGKARFAKMFFQYIDVNGLSEISALNKEMVAAYMESNPNYTLTTKQTKSYNLRGLLNWMYSTHLIDFSGYDAFPQIRAVKDRFIPSCYSNHEIKSILDSVDTSSSIGKHDYLVLVLLIYYGLRVSDVIALKQENIDWNTNQISLIQQKTGKPLVLPLIDEVKFPLLDYLKNARPEVEDSHILITLCAPYTCYARNQSLQRVVTKYMDKAGIDYSYRHHGTHALRHSLASGMLNENIPISAISGVLGHGNINTTDLYLTLDENDFREISLEVPDVSNS